MRKITTVLNLVLLLSMALTACGAPATTAPVPAEPAATEAQAAEPEANVEPAAEVPAADPYGKYDEAIVLTSVRSFETNETLPDGDTPENNQYTRYVKDQLNIDVEYIWTSSTADYDQKVNLTIASNDLSFLMRTL